MDKPTPRVNSALLKQNAGVIVRITGKILQHQGSQVILEASDHGQVNVHLSGDSQLSSQFVEVIGRVNQDGSIQEFSSIDLSADFDLNAYNKFVELAQQFPELYQ